MTHTAYRWRGDTFCEGDVVHVLTDHEPWSAWLSDLNVPGDEDAEAQLNEIATQFHVDRDDEIDCARRDFPVRLPGTPDPPTICSGCYLWFS